MKTHTMVDSPIGELTLVNSDGVLSGLYLPQHAHQPDPAGFGDRTAAGFEAAIEQLEEYFTGQREQFALDVAPEGTDFQRGVWAQVSRIPYGRTCSYGELTERIGRARTAVRAVGAANGRNPVSLVIPCHRVIGADGSLVGYGGGLPRKRYLLDLENPDRRGFAFR